jgi:myo-inositol-1-phosphate synthase
MEKTGKLGVWIAGARGDIATTLIVGTHILKTGALGNAGLTTELIPFSSLDLIPLGDLRFGGLDVVEGTMRESALTVAKRSGTFSVDLVNEIAEELDSIDKDIVAEPLADWGPEQPPVAADAIPDFTSRVRQHLQRFRRNQQLDHVVVVNLCSAEAVPKSDPLHETLDGLERLIESNRQDVLTPSICYCYAALREGCSYINFTPNPGPGLGAIDQLARLQKLPYYGNDGKTGETLVKTALAPMFLQRNLKILSWEGVNMLGNGDGRTLNKPDHKVSKLENKGNVLDRILGYSPHARVDINYVPSLGDWKTAWDLIHFEGFLGVKMTMQFTWQGCDSILAAPLILDMVRFSEYAARQGESGPMRHLAVYFKNPLDNAEMALYPQYLQLLEYAEKHLQHKHQNPGLESIG